MKVKVKVEFELETDDYTKVQPSLVDAYQLVEAMLRAEADLPQVRQITVKEYMEFEKQYTVLVETDTGETETHLIGVYSDFEKAKAEVMRLIGKNQWDVDDLLPGIVHSVRDLAENALYLICETEVDKQSDWK